MKRIVFVVVCLVASLGLFGLELNPKYDSVSVAGYQQKADAGDAEAAFLFSRALVNGDRTEKDEAKAMKYAQQAADGGFELAWRSVGMGYEYGWSGKTDDLKATECYAKFLKYAKPKAENGDAWSQFEIGCYLENGGLGKDMATAVDWFRKAASQGCVSALYNLGVCYELGMGVEKDVVEAVKWYRMAAGEDHTSAQCRLGLYYELGEGKNDEAMKWYRKAADQGNVDAKNLVASLAEKIEKEKEFENEKVKHRHSPEFCIEHGLELSETALREVIDELTYWVDTGNEIRDEKTRREHRDRFMGKRIKVSGTIQEVETTAFTDEVKLIVKVVGGKTISARFDGMSKDVAIDLNRGDGVAFEGNISNRPVTSTIAMDRCSMIR